MKDLRSPLAKARDKWLETKKDDVNAWADEANTHRRYIEARLEIAFLAGVEAQIKLTEKAAMKLEPGI